MNDWTSFTQRIYIEKPLQDVYDAWTIPQNLVTWFLEKADYTDSSGNKKEKKENYHAGVSYKWKWNNWDITQSGKVLKANGTDFLCFTFGNGGEVEIKLEPRDNGTELTLTQKDIPTDDESKMNFYVGCSNGWTFWLTNLKAWMEHGITLHARGLSKEEAIKRVNS